MPLYQIYTYVHYLFLATRQNVILLDYISRDAPVAARRLSMIGKRLAWW